MIAAHGIFEKAAIAEKAIPNCNLCYISGDTMKTSLGEFFKVMFDANAKSIGGALPSDDIYYIG